MGFSVYERFGVDGEHGREVLRAVRDDKTVVERKGNGTFHRLLRCKTLTCCS